MAMARRGKRRRRKLKKGRKKAASSSGGKSGSRSSKTASKGIVSPTYCTCTTRHLLDYQYILQQSAAARTTSSIHSPAHESFTNIAEQVGS